MNMDQFLISILFSVFISSINSIQVTLQSIRIETYSRNQNHSFNRQIVVLQ